MRVISLLGLFFFRQVDTTWVVNNGQVLYNNSAVSLKGLNWYGFETGTYCIEGLWQNSIDFYLSLMTNHSFNALRIPLSVSMLTYKANMIPNSTLLIEEPTLQNKTWLAILDKIFYLSAEKGIIILLDMHRVINGISTPLWYIPGNSLYPPSAIKIAWQVLLDRYQEYPNFLGIDLYNEPHYFATWGSDDIATDYRLFVEDLIQNVTVKYNKSFLFFFNGINWGKDMKLVGQFPLNLSENQSRRVVYSPHNYGPTININMTDFRRNVLYHDWEINFGYLTHMDKTLIVGEWGGIYKNPNEKIFMDTFVDYMILKRISSNFYFALNPFASDVQGLLAFDWTTVRMDKLRLLNRLVPNPTNFSFFT